MGPAIPDELLQRAAEWEALHRWERSELGKELRRLGLTFGEIRSIVPVPKGTLSAWCREVELTEEQIAAMKARLPSQKGVPRDTQRRRRQEIEAIRTEALSYAREHLDDPSFVGGVVLYWAEGSKTRNDLSVANADPAALRAFVRFVRCHIDSDAGFVLSMHLHEGNDESAARSFWRTATGLTGARFTKTFIKPRGTGHRKNNHPHGICRIRVLEPADHWNRLDVWIGVVSAALGPGV